jgi:uncharacterized lipoprotein
VNRLVTAAVVLVLATACGVSTEDTPQILDDSSSRSPEPTPSIAPPHPTSTSQTPSPDAPATETVGGP